MSFNIFRASCRSVASKSLRRGAVQGNTRTVFRSNLNRMYSTPPPSEGAKSSSSSGLYIGLGAVSVIGAAYYFYVTTSGKEARNAAKSGLQVKANFVPTKDDYIKVIEFVALVSWV